jgi:transcriptional regulator GlxA family with amidase domain
MTQPQTVLILLFDDVEVLDFTGPLEVFSLAGRTASRRMFNVHTVAESEIDRARSGLRIVADFLLEDAPETDILLVPGGQGTRRELGNAALIDWLTARSERTELMFSVCTGSLLLAKAGLLRRRVATTHHSALEELQSIDATVRIAENVRFVDGGDIIVSAGITAGIDAALQIVARICGLSIAEETARHMEYAWHVQPSVPDGNNPL